MKLATLISNGARAAAIGATLLAFGGTGFAQQSPSAAAIETAKQIVIVKGGNHIFDTLIPGVIEQGKSMFEQQNPALGKDLREVATKLRTDLAARQDELNTEVARVYASRFSEAELKDILAFYKSPLGKKMIVEEPKAIEESVRFAQNWSRKFSDEVLTKMRAEMKKRGHDI